MAARRDWRLESAVVFASFLVLLAVNAGFPVWWGGWSFGPRHLVPCVLLLCVPIAFVPTKLHPLVWMLLGVSLLQMAIPTVTTPTPSDASLQAAIQAAADSAWLPLRGSSEIWNEGLQALAAGRLRPNLGTLAGLPAFAALAIPAAAVAGLFAWAARRR